MAMATLRDDAADQTINTTTNNIPTNFTTINTISITTTTTTNNNNNDYYLYSDDMYSMYQQCGLHTIPEFPQFRVAEGLVTFVYPLLVVLGSLGNGVVVVVLSRLSGRVWSTCLYLAVLAGVDLAVLLIRCGGTWCLTVAGVNPSQKIMTSSDAMCKTYLFLLNVLLQLWPWLMVALSVELLICCRLPLRAYHLCTVERARATILLLTILLVCLNLNFFWTWGLLDGQVCVYVEEFSREFMNVIWPSIEMAVKHAAPLLVVGVVFVLTVVSLVREGREGTAQYEPVLKRYFLDLQALQELKTASLVLVFFFLLVKAFTFAVELTNALESRGYMVVECEGMARYRATFKLLQTLRDASVYSFHGLKFCVYFVSCAAFRRQCVDLARKVFFCKKSVSSERRGPCMGTTTATTKQNNEGNEGSNQLVSNAHSLLARSRNEHPICSQAPVSTVTSHV